MPVQAEICRAHRSDVCKVCDENNDDLWAHPRDVDPPLGACPPWCELPPGHDWEDLWANGLIRYHRWSRQVSKYHAIAVEEIEQHTPTGTVRQREVVLDVESPTQWDTATAEIGLRLLTEAVALIKTGAGVVGEVR